MRTPTQIRQALKELADKMKPLVATGGADYDAFSQQFKDAESELTRALDQQARDAKLALPIEGQDTDPALVDPNGGVSPTAPARALGAPVRMARIMSNFRRDSRPIFDDYLGEVRSQSDFRIDKAKHFDTLGEQLQRIQVHYMTKGESSDKRLVRAPTGANELDATGGGFLIQNDFAQSIFMLAHDMGEIIGEVNRIPISANSNGLKIPAVDETSRATGSRWGGVQSYWPEEGNTVTPSKPKFRRVEFDLKKLMSLMYVTDEMLQDSTALTAIASTAFSEEIMWMTEDAFFEGTGAGQPLGVMNSPCKIIVPKENGQKPGTLVYENVLNMYSRGWSRSRSRMKWFINQDLEPQLFALNQTIGLGGVPVYLPPGGLSSTPYATLLGRPVVPTEYNSTLGTEGDIMLADWSQYTSVDKGGVQAATSMHVAFLTDEQVFRITYRVDGKPMWSAPLTPAKGTNTKSPFITLATR